MCNIEVYAQKKTGSLSMIDSIEVRSSLKEILMDTPYCQSNMILKKMFYIEIFFSKYTEGTSSLDNK